MSLEGLRAWIGELERKLGARTRVFLVLVAIAIGGAGAGIYLALDAQSDRVTDGDLQAIEENLQGQIETLSQQVSGIEANVTDPRVAALELQLKALQAKVKKLEREGETPPNGGTANGSAGGIPGAGKTSRGWQDGQGWRRRGREPG